MSERDWRERVRDILDSIEAIKEYASNIDRSALGNDPEKVDAILFRFSVIGEAVAHIPEKVRADYSMIP